MVDAKSLVDLRQFSRAVLADRTLGDELLRLALRRLPVADDGSDRVGMFRAFVAAWRGLREGDAGPAFSDVSLSQALPPPPRPERLMLVLVDVMGFDLSEAGTVVGCEAADWTGLLAAGRAWAEGPFVGRALIIEDEPLIAAELRALVARLGVTVVGAARTAPQAVRLAETHRPDVLIADYNLDGPATGLDAVHDIQERMASPVVFITGYPERVLAGDDVEPDFVLAKPYTSRAISAAVAFCLTTERLSVTD